MLGTRNGSKPTSQGAESIIARRKKKGGFTRFGQLNWDLWYK